MSMKELTFQELKSIEYNLLQSFDAICSEKGYRYSLGGGTLLGAIRHKGFIPWDDDIDVMMPRPDYDCFIKYCEDNTIPFVLECHEYNPSYKNLFSKIIAKNTFLIDSSITTKATKMGVHIDVFPIDGLGNSYKNAIKQFEKTTFKRELLNAATWEKYFRSKTHPWYYEPLRLSLYLLSRFQNAKNLMDSIDVINREVSFDESKFAGCVSGVYRKKEIMETSVFQNYIDVQFEGGYFKAIRDYDAYLQKHYGDYMKLPPKEKRVTHHTFKAYIEE